MMGQGRQGRLEILYKLGRANKHGLAARCSLRVACCVLLVPDRVEQSSTTTDVN